TLNQNTTFNVAGGGTLKLTNLRDASVGVTKEGAGVLNVNRIRAAALMINAGAVSTLGPRNLGSTSRVTSLNIAGQTSPTATLDLGANDLILDYTGDSPLATVAAQIKSAFNNGNWNGNGITTSASIAGAHPTGLGY